MSATTTFTLHSFIRNLIRSHKRFNALESPLECNNTRLDTSSNIFARRMIHYDAWACIVRNNFTIIDRSVQKARLLFCSKRSVRL